jgi:3-hydroxyisobutyrate dehydrogenase
MAKDRSQRKYLCHADTLALNGGVMTKIGFVGLGHMGLPMAINLVKAGHHVIGYDLQSSTIEQLVTAGGHAAHHLHEVAIERDVVITMVQTGQQVMHVCVGIDGLFTRMRQGSLFIDCSTIDVKTARDLHQHAAEFDLLAVDAPVSGGVAGAHAATLTFMVGGTSKACDTAKPVLSAMGQKIITTGDAGSGQAAKICNNMILGISMVAVSEAFILAEQLGLSAEKLFDVVTHASGQCWAMSHYVPVPGILDKVPANHDYQPGFTATMMLKDLILSQQAAKVAQIKTPLGAKTMELYQQFIDEGQGKVDFSAIIKLLASSDSFSR